MMSKRRALMIFVGTSITSIRTTSQRQRSPGLVEHTFKSEQERVDAAADQTVDVLMRAVALRGAGAACRP
jgi:hypothetical protein